MSDHAQNISGASYSDKFGGDAAYLEWCAEWHVVRAKQRLIWAQRDAADGWGAFPCPSLESEPIDRMCEIQSLLESWKPRTIMGAQQLIEICISLLAEATRKARWPRGRAEVSKEPARSLDRRFDPEKPTAG